MHLYVAILSYDAWVHHRCMQSCMQLFAACMTSDRQMPFSLGVLPGECFLGHGRNQLTRVFLRSNATHMLMLDTDIAFKAEQFFRMLDFDADVVSASYSYRQFPPKLVGTFDPECPEEVNGFRRAIVAPSGCMLIKRVVVEKMAEIFSNLRYHDVSEKYDGLWNTFIEPGGRLEGEDGLFCARALAAGFKVWIDLQSKVSHIGETSFELP